MIPGRLLEELAGIVGRKNILFSGEALKAYSYDGTTSWISEPDAVLFPTTSREVSSVMRMANSAKIPVTPRGSGTNLSGGSIPVQGGIVLCTSRMNRIVDIDKDDMRATVEPGVVLQDLNLTLAKDGLFFPPDPQSMLSATLGGMIAENAGGPACLKYGVTKQYILGIEVVLPTGEIIHLGGKTLNNVVGYDLLHLFIGSEGTLGVITKTDVKIMKVPPSRNTVVAVYSDLKAACETVFRILENGVIPGKIEFIDNWVINKFEDMMQIGLPRDAAAVLLIEADGAPEAVPKEIAQIAEIAVKYGAIEARVAKDADEANKYWMGRKAGFAAVFGAAATVMAEDMTVPRGKIPDLASKCEELSRKYNVEIVVLGHAGDGNLHPAILTDANNKEHYGRATRAMDEIFETAIELGGVISGEHGIGLEKAKFFTKAVDPVVVDLMKKLKAMVDPNNIMNPGKIWT
jgi:glycolate oxidase